MILIYGYVCGFEPFGTAPSKSCFSRFYSKLAQSGCLETLFTSLVKQAEEMGLLDLSSVAIDATKVEAYEKSIPVRISDRMVMPLIGVLRVIPTATLSSGLATSSILAPM